MSQQNDFARRRAERQKRIRRRRLFIGTVVFLIFAVVVTVLLAFTVFFPIQEVTVKGETRYSEEQVIDACELKPQEQVLAVTANGLKKRIQKTLPYIETVKIHRKLPHGISLTVKDADPWAAYRYDDNGSTRYAIVNEENRVLERRADLPENMVIVSKTAVCDGNIVTFKDKITADLIRQISDSMQTQKLAVNEINISSTIAIKVTVENRFIVDLGTSDNLDKKTTHLGAMIREAAKDVTGRIDLSMWSPVKPEGTFVEGLIGDTSEKAAYLVKDIYYVVNADDRVVRSTADQPKKLPIIRCEKASCTTGRIVSIKDNVTAATVPKIMTAFKKAKLSVKELDVNNINGIEIKLKNGCAVRFGSPIDIQQKVAYIKNKLSESDKGTVGTFDFSGWTAQNPSGTFVAG